MLKYRSKPSEIDIVWRFQSFRRAKKRVKKIEKILRDNLQDRHPYYVEDILFGPLYLAQLRRKQRKFRSNIGLSIVPFYNRPKK
jgi:hypothetical protein